MCYIMTKKTTGDIVRDIRRQKGLTQEEFAESLGISNTYLAMIETGKRDGDFQINLDVDGQPRLKHSFNLSAGEAKTIALPVGELLNFMTSQSDDTHTVTVGDMTVKVPK